ncbi:potassium voltage-gated channel unc-103-like isoform X2 [Amphiura filiformis]|uniref:potassium voltage-gated channel unc-103-like isoform X2 n=1 Tax=Amphiura filiformis TaxID=82378 RepID=UPI003B213487
MEQKWTTGVTSPPRSPRPRHRLEMRKKDLSVDRSEVSRLTSDEINHKKLRTRTLHKFTILHYSPFKAVWDWVVLLLVVYTAIFTPYAAAFLLKDDERRAKLNKEAETRAGEGFTSSYTGPLVVVDLFVDIMFVFDIFINFRTTYVDEHKGEVVSDPARIAKHYLKGWFVIDVLAAVPFDLILFGIATDEKTTTTMGLLKTFRLLRLLRVARRLDQYSQYAPAVVLLLMCGFTLAAHWFACMWYAIGEHERPNSVTYGWLDQLSNDVQEPYKNDTTGGPSLEAKYVTSLYFTLTTLTTVGFGNVAPNTDAEKLFAICMMLVGSLMFACIFGNMTAIIERLYEGMARYHQQISLVKGFVKFHNVPNPLRRRLQEYFKHAWVYSNGNDITEVDEVMKDFPDFLQADISMHLNRNLLNNSAAFRGVNHGCLRALSMKFVTTHTAPGDILLHRGDNLGNMYFISRGSLEILRGNIVLAILGKNDVVGENFCLRDDVGRSKGTVRALTYCDLLALSREDLMDVIQLYPEFADHFARKVEVTVDMRDPDLDTLPPNDASIRNTKLGSSASGSQPTGMQGDLRHDLPGLHGLNILQAYERQRKAQQSGASADTHTRITLTPFASTENVGSKDSVASTHSSSYGFFKRKQRRGRGRGDLMETAHSIEMGNMAVMEDDENESAGSDVPMLHRKYRHYSEPAIMRKKSPLAASTKSMETHFDSTIHSVPQGKGAPELGNREAPEGAVTGSSPNQGHSNFQPSIVVEDMGESNSTAVHRRIDGLYMQLEGLERKFDEQKCAIIEVLLGKTVLTSPTSSSPNMRPGYHPMPVRNQTPSSTSYRHGDSYKPELPPKPKDLKAKLESSEAKKPDKTSPKQ